MNIQCLVLDLDETLYSRQSGLIQFIDRRIDEFIREKLHLPDAAIPGLRHDYFSHYGTTLSEMIINHRIDPEEYIRYVYEINPADFLSRDNRLAMILKEINLRKVVFSNSPLEYVERVLQVLGVYPNIHKIYDIRFNHFLGKPNSASYKKVLGDLGMDGAGCIMVDDSKSNILGAKNAGMCGVWLNQSNDKEIDWIIHDIYELKTIIPNIMQHQISA